MTNLQKVVKKTCLPAFYPLSIMFTKVFCLQMYSGLMSQSIAYLYTQILYKTKAINPLPDMPILGSSNSAVNKDILSKIRTNGDTII